MIHSASPALLARVARTPAYAELMRAIRNPAASRIFVSGLRGSAKAFLAAGITQSPDLPLIVVCPGNEAAEEMVDDIRFSLDDAGFFPEVDPGDYKAGAVPGRVRVRWETVAAGVVNRVNLEGDRRAHGGAARVEP